MNATIWIVQIILAGAFAGAGVMKLTRTRAQLAPTQAYVNDYSDGTIKTIGVLEVLAAIGLILPAITGVATVFVPLAALGLVLLMIAAAVVHARRSEQVNIVVNVVLLVLAALVVWGRFGPYPL